MKEKHVILREARRPGSDAFGRPMAGASGQPEMQVDVDELDGRSKRAAARSRGVVAIAPVIPMRLIAPVANGVAAAPAAGSVAWGITAVGADTSPFDGTGIVVAVLDTGIDPTHPAFAGVELVQQDFTGDGNGDQHGHGTHCAGTVFGRDVDGTRIGVARGVQKAFIGKVLGSEGGPSDQVVKAIQWAVNNGAHVISMSLGIDFPGFVKFLIEDRGLPAEQATTVALEGYRQNVLLFEKMASLIAAQAAFGQASIVVAAAGNESQRTGTPSFEIACAPPAVSDGFVSVAALEQIGASFGVASFSNTNAKVAAPGVGVQSARRGGGLVSMNGTSMATPHVAGVAALWAQKLSTPGPLQATELISRLVASGSAAQITGDFAQDDFGAGLVRAPQS